MIYYDSKSDKFIDNIDKKDITMNYKTNNNGLNSGADITLKLD